jgi:hypothetical protein
MHPGHNHLELLQLRQLQVLPAAVPARAPAAAALAVAVLTGVRTRCQASPKGYDVNRRYHPYGPNTLCAGC